MFLFAEGHHTPVIVEFINTYLGEPVCRAETNYLYPALDLALKPMGTSAEALFGACHPENAIPWYTIMFIIACILTMTVIWIFKGKLSEDDPTPGQLTLEAGFLALKDMIVSDRRRARLQIFSGGRDICGVDFDFEPDGNFPALYVADGFGQRYFCARHHVFYLLQLGWH